MTLSRVRIVTLVLVQALCGVGFTSLDAAAQEASAAPATPGKKVLGLRIEGFDLSAKDREDLFKVVQARLKSYPTIELVRPPEAELTDFYLKPQDWTGFAMDSRAT